MKNELNMLFSNKEFLEKNKDLGTREEILAAVQQELPAATMEDLDVYFESVNAVMDAKEGELNESALDQVSGGDLGGVCGLIALCYGAGEAIGRAIRNWRRK